MNLNSFCSFLLNTSLFHLFSFSSPYDTGICQQVNFCLDISPPLQTTHVRSFSQKSALLIPFFNARGFMKIPPLCLLVLGIHLSLSSRRLAVTRFGTPSFTFLHKNSCYFIAFLFGCVLLQDLPHALSLFLSLFNTFLSFQIRTSAT